MLHFRGAWTVFLCSVYFIYRGCRTDVLCQHTAHRFPVSLIDSPDGAIVFKDAWNCPCIKSPTTLHKCVKLSTKIANIDQNVCRIRSFYQIEYRSKSNYQLFVFPFKTIFALLYQTEFFRFLCTNTELLMVPCQGFTQTENVLVIWLLPAGQLALLLVLWICTPRNRLKILFANIKRSWDDGYIVNDALAWQRLRCVPILFLIYN